MLNHSGGVDIEVEGRVRRLDAFAADLEAKAPPLARIERVSVGGVPPPATGASRSAHSVARDGEYPLISPDIATCPDCLREIFDPADRRYRYPVHQLHQLRPALHHHRGHPLRPAPDHHARISRCARTASASTTTRSTAASTPSPTPARSAARSLELARRAAARPVVEATTCIRARRCSWLAREAQILAIKGLGGFHLACDATNAAAVDLLRERKHRPDKPLAVMVADLDEVRAPLRRRRRPSASC